MTFLLTMLLLLVGGGTAGAEPNSNLVVTDPRPPTSYERYVEMMAPCHIDYPPHVVGERGYRTYRTYEVYQLALFQEMCLSWYAMQQPKNHGIMLSRGAPNF